MSSDGNPRRVRVARSMREVLAEMLDREMKDPRVRAAGFITINHIELNSDMSVARVFVSFLATHSEDDSPAGNKVVERAMAGLQKAAGYLRGPLGRRLRLRHAPSLRFVADDSPIFQQRLRDLVRADDAASVDENELPDNADRSAEIDQGSGDASHGE